MSQLTFYGKTIEGVPATLILLAIIWAIYFAGYFIGHKQGVKDGEKLGVMNQKLTNIENKQ